MYNNGAQNHTDSNASIAGSPSCPNSLGGSSNYIRVCAETAHFLVSFCSTAAASSDKRCCGAFWKSTDHKKQQKGGLHATASLKYPNHNHTHTKKCLISMLTDSPGTQYCYQRKWALNGEAQRMKAFICGGLSQKQLPLRFAWILLANMGSEIP